MLPFVSTGSLLLPLDFHFSFILNDKMKIKNSAILFCCCLKKKGVHYKDPKSDDDDEENDVITNKRTQKRKKKKNYFWLFNGNSDDDFPLHMHMRMIMTPELLLTREPIIIIIDQLVVLYGIE